MSGYLHRRYAESLAEFGVVCELPRSGGWILKRKIPQFPHYDAMGCYPLFACGDWAGLRADLDALDHGLVSLAMVTDPFGDYTEEYLRRCFRDVVFRYKDHFVVDLRLPRDRHICPHHLRNAAKALKSLDIRVCQNPPQSLDAWLALYDVLTRRHSIQGMRAFSRASFATQLRVPGLVAFEAVHQGQIVSMLLWYVRESVAYYHLGASNDVGYRTGASFGLFWRAIDFFFEKGLRWLDLGAGAGVRRAADGLRDSSKAGPRESVPSIFAAASSSLQPTNR